MKQLTKEQFLSLIADDAEAQGQAQLARKLNISRQYMNDIVKGRRNPNAEVLSAYNATKNTTTTYEVKEKDSK